MLSYVGYGALFVAFVAIVICAEVLRREHRATQLVTDINVEITEGEKSPLADEESIEHWVRDAGLLEPNTTLEKLDVAAIECRALEHNAVAEANAYVDYDGSAMLEVTLREPIARLRANGYDLYITEDGYVLPTVDDRTAAVPVITGDYKPLFRPGYSGYAQSVVADSVASLERVIKELEDAKLPIYRQLEENDKTLREALSEGVRKGIFMSDNEYELLHSALEARKVVAREQHTTTKRKLEAEIAALATQQDEARMKQSSVKLAGDDFNALLGFLKHINGNNFWRAEVVQILLSGGGDRGMELRFVPRSGNFVVDLGEPSGYDTKLSNLYRFYNKGLDNIGWDKYRSISLRYEGQVVCR
jgi:hypothetical protein